jgi:hypothetical protein
MAVIVHAEDEASVDHDAEGVKALGDGLVIAAEILALVAAAQVAGRQRFETYKDASQACFGGALNEIAAQNGVDCRGSLEETAHAFHAGEERLSKVAITEQMVIEEVEMTAGQAVNFGKRPVNTLRVEAAAALKESVLVTEVAMLRAAPSDNDGVRHEIQIPPDEIAADGRDALEGTAGCRRIDRLRIAGAKIFEELGEGLIAGAEEDRVGV